MERADKDANSGGRKTGKKSKKKSDEAEPVSMTLQVWTPSVIYSFRTSILTYVRPRPRRGLHPVLVLTPWPGTVATGCSTRASSRWVVALALVDLAQSSAAFVCHREPIPATAVFVVR